MTGIEGTESIGSLSSLLPGLAIGYGILMALLFLVGLPLLIVYIVALWKLFKKSGKQGWEAIVPFYNTYVLVELSGLNWWYFLIAISGTICSVLNITGLETLCALLSVAAKFFIFYNLAKKFHKEPIPWAIGGALVSPIMVMILGFSGKSKYDSSVKVSKNGPIDK